MALNWCKRDIVEKSKIKHRKNLWFERHGFEIQTGPYSPTWLTENYPLERFFYSQKLLYTKNQWTVWTEVESPKFENYNQVSRFRPKLQKKKQQQQLHQFISVETGLFCHFVPFFCLFISQSQPQIWNFPSSSSFPFCSFLLLSPDTSH